MPKAKDIRKVPVCFNVLDADQARMHEWVCSRPNRSGYLKRLIQRDMDGVGGNFGTMTLTVTERAVTDDDFLVDGFI
ncbi:hypothetical protein D3C84_887940 [compost metagenome]